VQGADGLQRGTGLADARRAGQGDQPAVADQPADGGEVVGAADQRGGVQGAVEK
jgi:hypothetical protein